jgi:hypothetical protein
MQFSIYALRFGITKKQNPTNGRVLSFKPHVAAESTRKAGYASGVDTLIFYPPTCPPKTAS